MTSLDEIPEEILFTEVFPRMDLETLSLLKQTSKKYRQLIDDYLISVSHKLFDDINETEIFSMLVKYPILQKAVIKELYDRRKIEGDPAHGDIEIMRAILIREALEGLIRLKNETNMDSEDWAESGEAYYFGKMDDYTQSILELSPDQITLVVNGTEVTGNKEFIRGVLRAIHFLQLKYDVKYKLSEEEQISIDPEDFTTFGGDGSTLEINVPFPNDNSWRLRIYFKSLDFLSGFKTIYDSNNIPFPIKEYYDMTNYSVIQIKN